MPIGEVRGQGSNTVRYVSGLAALPCSIRRIDDFWPEVAAVTGFVLLIVWLYWIW